jgi:hypothetical protein
MIVRTVLMRSDILRYRRFHWRRRPAAGHLMFGYFRLARCWWVAVAFSLGMGVAWLMFEGGSLATAPQRLIGGLDSFPLLAFLFILSGLLMNATVSTASTISPRCFGHRGRLGTSTSSAAPYFLNVGLAIADAGGLGVLEDPADEKDGARRILGRPHLRVHHRPLVPPDPDGDLRRHRKHVRGRVVVAGIVPGLHGGV